MIRKIALIILLVYPFVLKATCIVIIIRNDTIFIASDSRSTVFFRNQAGQKDSLFRSICKIHHSGSVYFAMAGHGDEIIPSIALKSFKNPQNILQSWNTFLAKTKAMLEEHFEQMRINDLNSFMIYKHRGDVCEFSVFGFNNNQPYLTTAFFDIASDEKTHVKIKISQNNKSVVVLGLHEHLDKLTQMPPINKKGLCYYEEDLINYEMSFHRSYIAPPIDLLQLTPTHIDWLRKKAICN